MMAVYSIVNIATSVTSVWTILARAEVRAGPLLEETLGHKWPHQESGISISAVRTSPWNQDHHGGRVWT